MNVSRLAPRGADAPMVEVLAGLARPADGAGGPFSDVRRAFCDDVSRAILGRPGVRAQPELVALAFFLRRAAVARLAEDFAALERATRLRAPLGLAFHVAPTNVDTVFAYSLLLAMLAGNRNVVRLSRNAGPEALLLVDLIADVLERPEYGPLRAETAIVSYGHEVEPTAAASLAADVRVIWGGDETVATIRAVPLAPGAREITFPDRFSFAAIDARAYARATDDERRGAARGLFVDAYPFDQRGCSSPRMVVFVGPPDAARATADALFADVAAEIAERRYELDTSAVLAKETFAFGAVVDRPVEALDRHGNELTVLRLAGLGGFDRTHPGAGLFFAAGVEDLGALTDFVTKKDQTLAAWGFDAPDLERFAGALGGRGLDRIVPFGEALAFSRWWDGHDMLADLTRTIDVRPG
jgi:Acyl-CoA reductase (LuxC)